MSFEIVANYQYKGYSLPNDATQAIVPASSGTSYYYPSDVAYSNVNGGEKWTKIDFTLTSFDDTISTNSRALPFAWGWKDGSGNVVSYSSWYLHTNGKMIFNGLYGGYILPNIGDIGICAHPGDLWFEPGVVNNSVGSGNLGSPTWASTQPSTYFDSTLQSLTSYGIIAERWNGVYTKFRYSGNNTAFNMRLEVLGYTDTSGVYHQQVPTDTYYQIDNSKYVVAGISSFSGMGNLYSFPLKTYNVNTDAGIPTTIPFDNLASIRLVYIGVEAPSGAQHSAWEYTKSWDQGGVTHTIYRVVVYCGQFSNHAADASYRISLYKAGASQKFSISLASDNSRRYGTGSSSYAGPYPHALTDTSLTADVNWLEQTWYSEDNGFTWYKYKPYSPIGGFQQYSTVTNMGPTAVDLVWVNNIRVPPIYEKLKNNAGATPYTAGYALTTTYRQFYTNHFYLGSAMSDTYLRFFNYKQAGTGGYNARNSTEQFLYNILDSSVTSGSGKGPYWTYYYCDLNNSGSPTMTVDDIYALNNAIGYAGFLDGMPGISRFRNKIVDDCETAYNNNNGDDSMMKSLIAGGWLGHTVNKLSTTWDEKLVYPGVRGVPPERFNLSISMHNYLGAVAYQSLTPLTTTYTVNHAVKNTVPY